MTEASRRFLSLWLRRLSTDRVARRDKQTPLAIAGTVGNAQLLTAVNDAAARLGLGPGLPLADARAMFPSLAVVESDTGADAALLEQIAAWCLRFTPLVGLAHDGLTLDITGCAHLFGGEASLRRTLLQACHGFGFIARAAIADTVGAAHALARHGKTAIAPPGGQREALADLPLAGLRLAPETVTGLKQSGFTTIGALYPLPRAPLAARFGNGLWLQLDRALGRQGEAIVPRVPVPAFAVERAFAEPLVRMEDILAIAEDLAARLTARLAERGQGARSLTLLLFRLDGVVQAITAGTSRPLRDAAFIRRLFADRLTTRDCDYDAGFGYDLVRLCAEETEALDAAQDGLANGNAAEAVARLTDRLTARLGEQQVLRLVEQDTHIPEAACIALPARASRYFAPADPPPQDTLLAARPLRLFARPQPLDDEAMAQVPDGPPIRFRWRRVLHDVGASEGPERIAMEWWRDAGAPARDYFRVATREGGRFWLYREGLTGASPRWFVHGLFA